MSKINEMNTNSTCPAEDATDNVKLKDSHISNTSTWVKVVNLSKFLILLILYVHFGSWIFRLLERRNDYDTIKNHRHTISEGRLNLTTSIAEIYLHNSQDNPDKLEQLVRKVIREHEQLLDSIAKNALKTYLNDEEPIPDRWSYVPTTFFVATLLATIGYGNMTPTTYWGRAFCIPFSVIGIPLMLIVIAKCGIFLADVIITFGHTIDQKWRLGRVWPNKITTNSIDASNWHKMIALLTTIIGALSCLSIYLSFGAWIYDRMESWGFLDSFYFCFITLTTIGFGDFIPKVGTEDGPRDGFVIIRAVYILLGLAVTSTAIELIRKHYSILWSQPPVPEQYILDNSNGK